MMICWEIGDNPVSACTFNNETTLILQVLFHDQCAGWQDLFVEHEPTPGSGEVINCYFQVN